MTTEPTMRVQAVLYDTPLDRVDRSLASIAAAAAQAIGAGALRRVVVRYGDAGPAPVLSPVEVAERVERYRDVIDLDYVWFGVNTGYGRGHNRLAADSEEDLLFLINPDVVLAPRCLSILVAEFDDPRVGIADAKQIPIEHPKDYDRTTGETVWVSGACAIVRRGLFERVGGFDAESFFMYMEDVDLSWRVRELGYRAVHQSAAVVFHDKRLGPANEWAPSLAEQVHSARGALVLAYKWSRDDVVEDLLSEWSGRGPGPLSDAVDLYEQARREGSLPERRDPEHRIGRFDGGTYGPHRYPLIEDR